MVKNEAVPRCDSCSTNGRETTATGRPSRAKASLDAFYGVLPARARVLYRRYGLHPGVYVTAEMGVAVTGYALADVEGLLGGLVSKRMVEQVGGETTRYRLIDRAHAREVALAEERGDKRQRVLNAIINQQLLCAVSRDGVLNPARSRLDLGGAITRFRRDSLQAVGQCVAAMLVDLEDLLKVQEAAAGRMPDRAWLLADAMSGVHRQVRLPQMQARSARIGSAAAKALNDPAAEARMSILLGYAHMAHLEFVEVYARANTALGLSQVLGDVRGMTAAYRLAGTALTARGDHDAALGVLGKARDLIGGRFRRDEALVDRQIGSTLTAAGRPAEAIEPLQRAVTVLGRIMPDAYNHARAQTELARAHAAAGQGQRGWDLLQHALGVMRALAAPYRQAEVLVLAARILTDNGDVPWARDHLEACHNVLGGLDLLAGDPVRDAANSLTGHLLTGRSL